MITNFFAETHELNSYETDVLQPIIIKGLSKKIGKENSVTNQYICDVLKEKGYKLNNARLRKIIHNIRAKDLIPCLIATSKGYYVSDDPQEIQSYIKSLRERINSISFIEASMKRQLNKILINQNPRLL
jgi:predicted GTPase